MNLVRSNLLATADEIVQTRNHDAYARPMGSHYFWGCNGAVARQTVILMAADRATHRKILRLSSRNVYRDTCLDALNHLFGRNYYGRSFVTGLGFEPPHASA